MGGSIFEALMLICFGVSWPFSIIRSVRARSVKGKSLAFLILAGLAYICGILHKLIMSFDYVIVFYIINFIMVSIDIVLYIRNSKLDSLQQIEQGKAGFCETTDKKPF